MATVTIPQNLFYIIIAAIALVAVIVVVVQWRKVREVQNNVSFAEKQIQLKKIAMVEKDLEAKRLMENVIPLPEDQQKNLAQIRQNTSELMHKIGYLHSEINERVTRLEAQTEYKKLQHMLVDIEKKEKEIEKNMKGKGD
ncbi:MAG: hypothetical protein ACP5C3_05395 [Methanomicrobiales archaeon]